MKKTQYIQRAYDEGFCDGVNQSLKLVNSLAFLTDTQFKSAVKVMDAMKEKR